MHKYFYMTTKNVFLCYKGSKEINTESQVDTFIASTMEFGIGHTKESALEDLNFNLAGTKNIKLQG
ncbi:hypothetical protein HJP15_13840 [Pseudoalteromonas sp. NEC-BIFX-2020_002]|uniref:hypothetical protein n=1 Tax=Pseudoalteromonas sp. NEC-BIFX-2020_002 TaxID=2732353 RepID=UPI0014770756|nr:hypothetical protein [Pseudoalteromonas sp. NEC-BIFX-2020_002]NNG43990.1 hypothetical protein [Pseudoalteromonas sp. NEC-BIFX-2020_002]